MSRSLSAASRRAMLLVSLVAGLFDASVHAGPANGGDFASRWRDREIRVDGNDEEWGDLLNPVKGQKFSVGIVNDDVALYLCLVTKDRVPYTQISRQGLILWLDPASGRKRAFGLQFPVGGLRPPRGPARGMEGPGGAVAPSYTPPPPGGQEAIRILGPKQSDAKDLLMDETGGIVARVGIRGDLLVYEIKVPLKRNGAGPYAVNVEPGGTVRLGMQTPEWRGPVPAATSSPVAIGVGGPHGMVGFPPADAAMLRPVDVNATVRLAAGGR
jgi:hypothetical protein